MSPDSGFDTYILAFDSVFGSGIVIYPLQNVVFISFQNVSQ